MRLSKVVLAYAAASMAVMPVAATAATANPAAKLSLSKAVPSSARVATKAGKSKAAGTGIVILIAAVAAVGLGIAAATTGGSSEADSN